MFGTGDLLKLISDIGLIPTILIVSVALFFLHKEIKKSLTGLGSSIDKLRESSTSSLAKFKAEVEAQEQKENERMERMEKSISSSMEKMRLSTEDSLRLLKNEIEERNVRQDARMDALEKELKFIGREYVSKEQHFNDTEGWKSNLDSIRRDLAEMPIKMITLIKEIKA